MLGFQGINEGDRCDTGRNGTPGVLGELPVPFGETWTTRWSRANNNNNANRLAVFLKTPTGSKEYPPGETQGQGTQASTGSVLGLSQHQEGQVIPGLDGGTMTCRRGSWGTLGLVWPGDIGEIGPFRY